MLKSVTGSSNSSKSISQDQQKLPKKKGRGPGKGTYGLKKASQAPGQTKLQGFVQTSKDNTVANQAKQAPTPATAVTDKSIQYHAVEHRTGVATDAYIFLMGAGKKTSDKPVSTTASTIPTPTLAPQPENGVNPFRKMMSKDSLDDLVTKLDTLDLGDVQKLYCDRDFHKRSPEQQAKILLKLVKLYQEKQESDESCRKSAYRSLLTLYCCTDKSKTIHSFASVLPLPSDLVWVQMELVKYSASIEFGYELADQDKESIYGGLHYTKKGFNKEGYKSLASGIIERLLGQYQFHLDCPEALVLKSCKQKLLNPQATSTTASKTIELSSSSELSTTPDSFSLVSLTTSSSESGDDKSSSQDKEGTPLDNTTGLTQDTAKKLFIEILSSDDESDGSNKENVRAGKRTRETPQNLKVSAQTQSPVKKKEKKVALSPVYSPPFVLGDMNGFDDSVSDSEGK